MNDLELLKEIPSRPVPLDEAARGRIRRLMEERSGLRRRRFGRRGARSIALVAAAVLTVGVAAAAVTQHLWTRDRPVAIPIDPHARSGAPFAGVIPNPDGQITSPAELTTTVGEFAPSIRLPEGGSFDEWSAQFATHLSDQNPADRAEVAGDMVVVAGCQWAQRWLDASPGGDGPGAAQAVTVLGQIGRWRQAAGIDDTGQMSRLADRMAGGDRESVQLFENQCAFTGSWGATAAQRDAKATADLGQAALVAQDYLSGGGDPAAFDPSSAQGLAPGTFWTSMHMQPVPARPGAILIAESPQGGVALVSVSESGTQFCALVSDSAVVRGTTTSDLSVVPDGDGAQPATPGPIDCVPGGW